MTILEKITGAFFKTKDMTLYAKDPNSHTYVVLDWSSLVIGTWLYPKKSVIK